MAKNANRFHFWSQIFRIWISFFQIFLQEHDTEYSRMFVWCIMWLKLKYLFGETAAEPLQTWNGSFIKSEFFSFLQLNNRIINQDVFNSSPIYHQSLVLHVPKHPSILFKCENAVEKATGIPWRSDDLRLIFAFRFDLLYHNCTFSEIFYKSMIWFITKNHLVASKLHEVNQALPNRCWISIDIALKRRSTVANSHQRRNHWLWCVNIVN